MSQIYKAATGGGGGGGIQTLTFDSGGAVSPNGSGNITITGNSDLNFVGTPGTNSAQGYNWTKFSPYVVGTDPVQYRFTSIQDAIDQAVIDGSAPFANFTVYVTAGTYTEDITAANVNIVGIPSDSSFTGLALTISIVGTITVSSTCFFDLTNISVNPSGTADSIITTAGGAGSAIVVFNTALSPSGSGLGINDAFGVSFIITDSNIKGYSCIGFSTSYNTLFNGVAVPSGSLTIFNSPTSSSSSWDIGGTVQLTNSFFSGNFNLTGTGTARVNNCFWNPAGSSNVDASSTLTIATTTINGAAAPLYTGTGTVTESNVTYAQGFATSTVTTQVAGAPLYANGGQIVKVKNVTTSYPVDPLLDYFIGVDTGTAVTVTLPSTPFTGQRFEIADITGTAIANNITVSGNGANINFGGTSAATKAIITNYGSMKVTFNGTTWSST